MSSRARSRKFQAQTEKLLDMMIHSVYSQKEVFLRELISNASDAIDKVRFLALTDRSLADSAGEYRIELLADPVAGTLTIRDNGIGMSEQEAIDNLGTIARSGSAAFQAAASERDPELERDAPSPEAVADGGLIGQFGVGFYSVFMVADKVTVISQKHGEDHAVKWISTGGEQYMVQRLPVRERGTTVTLQLKREAGRPAEDDEDDVAERSPAEAFTDPATLRRVVKQHSDFIAFPIVLLAPDAEGDGEARTPETLNSMRPLWTRRPKEIERADYDEFYRHITRDWHDPFEVLHLHVEGMREYTALLYLPSGAPLDLYTREHRRGLQLYARRVFIMEECRDLMPEYLRFVRGLVDSPDIPLNISREMVQQDRLIASIRKQLTRRVLAALKDRLAGEREAYEAWWSEFGPVLKEGFHYEPVQAPRLQELLLFRSTAQEGWTSLAEYIARMPEAQQAIYYVTGESLELLRDSPQLEAFRARDVEVLLLPDPVDELMVAQLGEVEGKALRSAARGDVDPSELPGGADAAQRVLTPEADGGAATPDELGPLLGRLQQVLDETIESVRVSHRLTDSAVCLVAPEGSLSPQLEQMMRAMGQALPEQKRILEVNAGHPLLQRMYARYSVNPEDPQLRDYAEMLLDQALLAEGAPLKNPARFARRVAEVMAKGMG
ncbi:MAG: molecular chaperone HtpG [Chloroflexi bacterium]|nr:molecular chaperone HtpG [Chloroflexota bacterium]